MTSPIPEETPRPSPGAEFVGSWYTWWPGDPLPTLPPLPDFITAPADDRTFAAAAGIDVEEVVTTRRFGNQPYLARFAGEPVAYGWSTGSRVEIGEVGLSFTLPPGERYLWGFVTREQWRGRGIYPHLLRAILRHEESERARYWIGHDPGNQASAKGILKAGFGRVGDVYRLTEGRLVLVPVGPIERARVGAALLGAELNDRSAT